MHQGSDEQRKKIKVLQRKVDETKAIMEQNIALAIERGALLEDIVSVTGELRHTAQLYSHEANELQENTSFQNLTLHGILLGIALGLVYGAFSGFYWPFLIVSAVLGGAAGYMMMWTVKAAKQMYNRFGTFDGWRHEIESKVSHVIHPQPTPKITPFFENSVANTTASTPSTSVRLLSSSAHRLRK